MGAGTAVAVGEAGGDGGAGASLEQAAASIAAPASATLHHPLPTRMRTTTA
jgi:hypothetical protein